MYADDRTDKSVSPQRLLMLNWEDYVKIKPILQNPPSETKVVASNLRFTCWNYYDCLQFQTRIMKVQSEEELESIFNGNIVTLYDIANLYTKGLGIKTVPNNGELNLTDIAVELILQQYYQQKGNFESWIKNTTVWAFFDELYFFGINQRNVGSAIYKFENFQLDFTTEGNTLTYDGQK